VKLGLLQRVFATNLRVFARGVSDVRYGRGGATTPSGTTGPR